MDKNNFVCRLLKWHTWHYETKEMRVCVGCDRTEAKIYCKHCNRNGWIKI